LFALEPPLSPEQPFPNWENKKSLPNAPKVLTITRTKELNLYISRVLKFDTSNYTKWL
jgi:hypothetical protein